MERSLRVMVGALGLAACAISAAMGFLGPAQTLAFGEALYEAILGSQQEPAVVSASVDSELRFYSALFMAFGAFALRAAYNFERHGHDIMWLAAIFFVGGAGRAWSLIVAGPPHPFYLVLMVTELLVPPALGILWLGHRRGKVGEDA